MSVEVWREVEDYEGLYMVSSKGRIRSLDKHSGAGRSGIGKGHRFIKGKILKARLVVGYPQIKLCRYGKNKQYKVHRLVASAFIPKILGKNIVNHKNSIRNDNNVENLEWCTCKENIRHAQNKKRMSNLTGETNIKSKIKEPEVKLIRELILYDKTAFSRKWLAKTFKVSITAIASIDKRKTWSHM